RRPTGATTSWSSSASTLTRRSTPRPAAAKSTVEEDLMLAFRDFVPRQLRSPHFGLSFGAIEGDYETFEDAVAAARAWLAEERPTVIQIETVVLPDIWERT